MSDSSRLALLALGPNEWLGSWAGRQQLLSRLAARGHFILYTTGLNFSWDARKVIRADIPLPGSFSTIDNVIVDRAPGWLLRWNRVPSLDRLVVQQGCRRWLKKLSESGNPNKAIIVFHPRFAPYLMEMRDIPFIYHAFDLFSGLPGWTREFEEQERWIVENAHTVLAVSNKVRSELRARYGRQKIDLLENGVDFELFTAGRNAAEPPDMASIPRPRVGYVGRINRKIDIRLIAKLARAMPDMQFVLVGPIHNLDSASQEDLAAAKGLPNVHLLGPKSPDELPAYMAAMDVNTMPYDIKAAPWMAAAYPLKMHEYLAVGRPVVSASIDAVQSFLDVLSAADNVGDWTLKIRACLANWTDTQSLECMRVASQNSWDVRVNNLEKHVVLALAPER